MKWPNNRQPWTRLAWRFNHQGDDCGRVLLAAVWLSELLGVKNGEKRVLGLKMGLNRSFFGVKFIRGYREAQANQGLRNSACASNTTDVFKVINKHERRRRNTRKPLQKLSVRLDLHTRKLEGLSRYFSYELFSPHSEDMDNSNNCSIVLKLSGIDGNGFSYLITGDTENERWDTITRLFGKSLSSDILSAPHHGSKNAVHPKMALLVSPDTVLISAGVENQYGHPDAKAVKLYGKVARQVFQTNIKNGVSLLTSHQGNEFVTRCVQ